MTVYVRTPYRNIARTIRHPHFSVGERRENMHVHFPIDVIESDDNYTISAILPGIDPKDIDIQIQDKQIDLRGEFKNISDKKDKYIVRERPAGKFHRSISLPDLLNATKAEAKMENGILSISIPKSEEAKPKKIKVTAN